MTGSFLILASDYDSVETEIAYRTSYKYARNNMLSRNTLVHFQSTIGIASNGFERNPEGNL